MPFTPAHTVAVLPFFRFSQLSATGLIIGSISPDFEYFIKMDVDSYFSHTLGGLFYFDIPVTLVLALIYHQIVKENFYKNLPIFLQRRLMKHYELDFLSILREKPIAFLLSALLGAATHVFWDGFTHNDGFFVKLLPGIYEGSYLPFDGVRYPLWYALQHISTFLGMAVLLIYIVMMKPESGKVFSPGVKYWLFVALVSCVILAIRLELNFQVRIGTIVVSWISACCIAVILMGWLHFDNRVRMPG